MLTEGAGANGGEESEGQEVCRDFLRNVCMRGDKCKYPHPSSAHPTNNGATMSMPICHDYQNWACDRQGCRYLHITKEEQRIIKETGVIPQRVYTERLRNPMAFSAVSTLIGEKPICKDNLKGRCNRGAACKFRHLSKEEDGSQAAVMRPPPPPGTMGAQPHPMPPPPGTIGPQMPVTIGAPMPGSVGSQVPGTVGAQTPGGGPINGNVGYPSNLYGDHRYLPYASAVPKRRGYDSEIDPYSLNAQNDSLVKENALLKMKVEKLQKQVEDLTNANEMLLSTNVRLRTSKAADLSVVTVSSAMTPVVSPVVVGMAPQGTNTQAQLSVLKPTHVMLDNDLVAEAALRQQAAASLVPVPLGAPACPPSQPSLVPLAGRGTQPSMVAIAGTQPSLVPLAGAGAQPSQPNLMPLGAGPPAQPSTLASELSGFSV